MAYQGGGGYGGGGGYPPYDSRGRGNGGGPPGGYQQDRGRPAHQGYRGGGGGGDGRNFEDRSRSREPFGRGQQGRGRDTGRGGGGRGGRGRGGGEDLSTRREQVRLGMMVQTNQWEVEVQPNVNGLQEWIMYHVQIQPTKKTPVLDKNKEKVRDEQNRSVFEYVPKPKRRPLFVVEGAAADSTFLTRRILMEVQRTLLEDSKFIFTDGTNIAYAPDRIVDQSKWSECSQMPMVVDKKPKAGPADEGTNQGQQAKSIQPFFDKHVNVPIEADLVEGERGKREWYNVRFTEVRTVQFAVARNTIETDQTESIVQCLSLVLKNAMMMCMMPMGPSPRLFPFPQDQQTSDKLGKRISTQCRPTKDYAFFVALRETVKVTKSKKIFLVADLASEWIKPEILGGKPIPILKPDPGRPGAGTLADIPLNLDVPVPEGRRPAVAEALNGVPFHIKYKCGEAWEQKSRDQGRDEAWIKSRRTLSRRNRRLMKPGDDGLAVIVWAADDPSLYSFRMQQKDADGKFVQVGEPHTVASYYKERYDITLNYPKMPLVRISKKEYFPVEFLLQAMEKVRNANSDEQKKHVLAFNDEFAGPYRIKHISKLLESLPLGDHLRDMLNSLKLSKKKTPLQLKADVLPYPELQFGTGKGSARPPRVSNGSWSLQNQKFTEAAALGSFAIVDFSGGSDSSWYFQELFTTMKNHGMKLLNFGHLSDPDLIKLIRKLTVVERSHQKPENVYAAVRKAIDAATKHFLRDEKPLAQMFQTNAINTDAGNLVNVLTVPIAGDRDTVGLILPPEPEPSPSYVVTILETRDKAYVQLMYAVVLLNSTEHNVHPFHLRRGGGNSKYEAKIGGTWCVVRDEVQIRYMLEDENILEESEVENPTCRFSAKLKSVECPSIIFVILPDNKTVLYNLAKLIASMDFGVQSQCLVKQGGKMNAKPQTLSNVCLKVNGKLFDFLNHAHAWNVKEIGAKPWLREVPTMVIGISMSAGAGQDGKMIVSAACSLDGMKIAQDCRIQNKASIIADQVLQDLISSLAVQFFMYHGKQPERVLLYRNGGHDGLFMEILTNELVAIRRAFSELNKTARNPPNCHTSECDGNGCEFCTPLITIVVAQSQHGVKIVPSEADAGTSNVPSGTCINNEDILTSQMTSAKVPPKSLPEGTPVEFYKTDQGASDFFLIPHGGLKGTSKAVYYRMLWNENAVFKSSSEASQLTSDVLQRITYLMSFQYSTATKSPRLIPVLLYSSRLANVAIGWLSYLPDFQPQKDDDSTIYVTTNGSRRVLPAYDGFGDSDHQFQPGFHPHLSA